MLLWNHYPHFVLSIVEVNDKTKQTNYEDVLNNLFNLIYINVEIVDRKSAVHTITQDVSQILVSPIWLSFTQNVSPEVKNHSNWK